MRWVIASLDPTYELRRTRDREMTPEQDALDRYIDTAAEVLALPVEPNWKPAVKANLLVTLRLAAVVAEVELPDEAEPAPTFEA